MSEHGLDLGFAEERPTRSARHRHRQKKRGERRRSLTAFIAVMVFLAVLGSGGWYGFQWLRGTLATPDYAGSGTGSVVVQVKDGDTATDIGATLEKQGVVKSAAAFVDAAKKDSRSTTIQPGSYQLRSHMSGAAALALMLDPASKISLRVSIPDGLTVTQTLGRIAKQSKISLADLQKAAADPAALGVPGWAQGSLEGFLFPDTYLLEPGTDAETLLKTMVSRTTKIMDDTDFVAKAKARNITPRDALIVASLLEGEGVPSDYGKIARVVYNRLNSPSQLLQMDSTTVYGRELRGIPRQTALTQAELNDPSDRYSTYAHKGLPPTPISNPGEKALAAAVNPEPGPWLFFVVVSKDGTSAFAATLAEHEQNIAKCKAIGKCQ